MDMSILVSIMNEVIEKKKLMKSLTRLSLSGGEATVIWHQRVFHKGMEDW